MDGWHSEPAILPARSWYAACLPWTVHRAALCMVPAGGSAIPLEPRQPWLPSGQVTVPDHAAAASIQATLTDVSNTLNEVPGAACSLSSAMPL